MASPLYPGIENAFAAGLAEISNCWRGHRILVWRIFSLADIGLADLGLALFKPMIAAQGRRHARLRRFAKLPP